MSRAHDYIPTGEARISAGASVTVGSSFEFSMDRSPLEKS